MKLQQGLISWMRRVTVLDFADGEPVAIRALRRGRRISWRTVSVASDDAVHERDVVLAGLRPSPGMTAWLQTPLLSRRKVRQVLPSVLDTKLPFPLEDCACSFGDALPANEAHLPVTGEGTAALAVVVRKRDLVALEEEFADLPFTPHLFDHEGIALWSSLSSSASDDVRVIVWCRSRSVLVVMGVGDVYWSSQRVDGHDAERVMRWIQLQRQTTLGGRYKGVALTWWVGGAESDVDAFWSCLDGVPAEHKHVLPDGAYYLARVMAERALLPGRWRIPALTAERGRTPFETNLARRFMLQGILFLVGALFLVTVVLGRRYYVRQQLQQEDQSVQQAVRAIAGYPVVARGWHAVLAAEEAFAERKALLHGFVVTEDLSLVAGAIASFAADRGGYVASLALAPESVRATVWLPTDVPPEELGNALRDYGYAMAPAEALQEDAQMVQYDLRGERVIP